MKGSAAVILTDFTGVSANEVNKLRRTLKAMQAAYQVVKKRLLRFVFKELGIEFDSKQFSGQVGVVFSPKDIVETSHAVYAFSKTQKDVFKILGGFDVAAKQFIEGGDVKKIGQLPSREILLAQVVGMIAFPLKSLMYVLNETSKKRS